MKCMFPVVRLHPTYIVTYKCTSEQQTLERSHRAEALITRAICSCFLQAACEGALLTCVARIADYKKCVIRMSALLRRLAYQHG